MLKDWFQRLELSLAMVGAVAVFLMMLLVTAEVFLRTVFNNPIAGQSEIVGMLMVVSVYAGISYTQRTGGHVGMDLLLDRVFRGRVRAGIILLNTVLSLLITVIIAIYTWKQAIETIERGTRSIYLHWPVWPLPLMVSIGSIVLCFRFLLEIREQLASAPPGQPGEDAP